MAGEVEDCRSLRMQAIDDVWKPGFEFMDDCEVRACAQLCPNGSHFVGELEPFERAVGCDDENSWHRSPCRSFDWNPIGLDVGKVLREAQPGRNADAVDLRKRHPERFFEGDRTQR